MNEMWVEVEGRSVKLTSQNLKQQLWVHFQGRTFILDTETAGRKSGGRAGANKNPEIIKAPMPGKITKIFLRPNEAVEKGQALIVMEAMKMEYTLKAEMKGQILALEVKVGDQVPLGKTLIKLGPGA